MTVDLHVPLELRFKGGRDYLHGTDMYEAISRNALTQLPASRHWPVKLAVHAFARTRCTLTLKAPAPAAARPESAVADFTIGDGPEAARGWLEETGQPVTERYAYDEPRIVRLCRVEGNRVSIEGDSGYSPIEELVAMTKHLHEQLVPPASARWIFTMLELSRWLEPADAGRLAVEQQQNLRNRLTKSAVTAGGMALGHIYFSLVPR